jgi:hypothetical protein
MIEAKELRVGNWYFFENIMAGGVEYEKFSNWTQALDFEAYGKPIQLTPEMLKRCGFEKRNYGKGFQYCIDCTPSGYKESAVRYLGWIDWDGEREYIQWRPYFSGEIHSFKIEYLHQLQNLYYALTQTELEVNL